MKESLRIRGLFGGLVFLAVQIVVEFIIVSLGEGDGPVATDDRTDVHDPPKLADRGLIRIERVDQSIVVVVDPVQLRAEERDLITVLWGITGFWRISGLQD